MIIEKIKQEILANAERGGYYPDERLDRLARAAIRRVKARRGCRYLLLRAAFHGGGVVSRHRTLTGAERAHTKYTRCCCGSRRGAAGYSCQCCTCGCAGIWDLVLEGEPQE